MLPPHPTLRFRDVFPPSAHSLKKTNAPHALHLTYNARGALYQLLRALPAERGRTVLLPAFHCTALVEPVARAGFRASFYRVRPNFSVDFEDLCKKMSGDVTAVVAIHYFGFPAELEPFLELANRYEAYVVEDCAHSFLTRRDGQYLGHRGDFALYSYYKFAPSLSGGGLGVNRADFNASFSRSGLPLRERMVIGKRLIEGILQNAPWNPIGKFLLMLENKRVARKQVVASATSEPVVSQFVDDPYLFREDLALASMPRLCQRVIEACDWEDIISVRQRNYRLFGRLLQDTKLVRRVCPELPDDVCPWAFPLLLEDRVLHEQKLRALGVPLFTFGEVLHPLLGPLQDEARRDAEYLSQRLTMLPVHPLLREEDVRSFAEIINRVGAQTVSSAPAPMQCRREQLQNEIREGEPA
jgi:perosamine synthetase